MSVGYNSVQQMRAYLLGLLPPDEAAVLEEKYFTERSFFLQVQDEERRLIRQYLDRELSPHEMERFDLQYQSTPELRRKLEQFAMERRVQVSPRRQPMIWWAAACLAALSAAGILAYLRSRPIPQLVAGSTGPVYSLRLTPGVEKGPNERMPSVSPDGGMLRLSLDLPGATKPVLCAAKISQVSDDGRFVPVWQNLHSAWSSPSGNSDQELVLMLPARLFRAGDYVVEVQDRTGTKDTYIFRVSRRP
jgi:hypothetical protein